MIARFVRSLCAAAGLGSYRYRTDTTFVQVRFSFGAMEWQRLFPVAAQDGLPAAAVTLQSVAGSCAVKPRSHFALSGTSG